MSEGAPAVQSGVFGVSIRGWIVLLLVGTECLLAFFQIESPQVLDNATLIAIGYYFGQKNSDTSLAATPRTQ